MSCMRSHLRKMEKRLQRIRAKWEMERTRVAPSQADIEQAALRKLSAADRALFQSKGAESSDDTQEYKDFVNRWRVAITAAWREVGVVCICLTESDRGWL